MGRRIDPGQGDGLTDEESHTALVVMDELRRGSPVVAPSKCDFCHRPGKEFAFFIASAKSGQVMCVFCLFEAVKAAMIANERVGNELAVMLNKMILAKRG